MVVCNRAEVLKIILLKAGYVSCIFQAARTLAVLMCKHEYDARYQTLDDKLYIAQRYFPLVTHVSSKSFSLVTSRRLVDSENLKLS